MIKIG
jgi:hypothetical protein